MTGGRRGASVKTLKKLLKKAGLKTSGKKAALTRRVKKAHLKMRGGEDCGGDGQPVCPEGGRRRRHRGGEGEKFAVGDMIKHKKSGLSGRLTADHITVGSDGTPQYRVSDSDQGEVTGPAADFELVAEGGRRRRGTRSRKH